MRDLRNRWIRSGSSLTLGAIFALLIALGMTQAAKADSTVPVGPSPDAVSVYLFIDGGHCDEDCPPPPPPPPPPPRAGIQSAISLGLSGTSTPGLYLVTGISGYYSDPTTGISGQITGLEPMDLSMVPTTIPFSPPAYTAAGFGYDNLIYPSGAPNVVDAGPFEFLTVGDLLDEYGLAFDVQGGYTVNLLGGRSAPDAGQVYAVSDALGSEVLDEDVPVSVNATPEPSSPTPEPSTLAYSGTGLLVLTGILRRRFR